MFYHGTKGPWRNYDTDVQGIYTEMDLIESPKERRARYKRLAIAAAAAAARSPIASVRTAYLLLAESWSSLAEADEPAGPEESHDSALAALDNPQSPEAGRDDAQPE